MRVRITLLLLSVALLGFAPAPLPRKERQRVDLTDVQGTWEFLTYDMNGRPYDYGKTSSLIEMKKDEFTFVQKNGGHRTPYKMQLLPASAPMAFTWSMGNNVMFVGSYRLQGDQITMIFRSGNNVEQRPRDFSAPCEYHYVMRRIKR